MQKVTDLIKKNSFVLLVVLLSVPTFLRMLRFGIYSMQDFHFFRLFEFDKCVRAFQIPCRWAPDAGLGYGEPLFNFYGQLSYAVGEVFHLLGFNLVDSLKLLFILSIVGSAVSMYFLAKEVWKNNYSALVSSMIYLYAPYRAVDVWVRGALPEALGFVLFPLIILSIEKKKFWPFSFLLSALILTHNLSALMFLPVIAVWIIYRKYWKAIFGVLVSLLLSAFYLLPLVFESKFVDLQSTIQGYFDFRGHFAAISQLFLSRSWGYGGSVFGTEDGLSIAIGFIQWILPAFIFLLILLKGKLKEYKVFFVLSFLALFYLFLTHNKSTFIWEAIPFMAYIQFPWRFLGVLIFCLSFASGAVVLFFEKYQRLIASLVIALVIVLNFSFFKEDIWYSVDDSYFTTGSQWDLQRTASIGDFWPLFGHKIPNTPSTGEFINYFPGWESNKPPEDGLIEKEGSVFKDTPVRKTGNIISLVTLCVSLLLAFYL